MCKVVRGGSSSREINVAFWGALDWMGGISYFSNLLNALNLHCSEVIVPSLILRPFELNYITKELSNIKKIIIRWDNIQGAKARAVLINECVYSHKIDLISHSPPFNDLLNVPTLGWIPDFQHINMKDMFSQKEISERDIIFSDIIKFSKRVIVSSETVASDLFNFMPCRKVPLDILKFRSNIFLQQPAPWPAVAEKYEIKSPYLFLPNQFWRHKNHMDVFRAVDLLNGRGLNVIVICSGDLTDYRNPQHYRDLLNFIETRGLKLNIKILGRIPREEFVALMLNALGVIQPSCFEGWSTTVEESRAMGKALILSDLPVHREQNPDKAMWFALGDYEKLADLMQQLWFSNSHTNTETLSLDYANSAAREYYKYAKDYEAIVYKTIGIHRTKCE